MREHRNRYQWIGGSIVGGLVFVAGMGFTEGSGEGSWVMPLFWAIVIGFGFIGLGGD